MADTSDVNLKKNEIKIYPNNIYMAHLGKTIGSEQHGDRPVLVVDSYLSSPVCVVLPMTLERLNDNRDYHIDLNNGKSTVLVEQIRTISKSRIYSGLRHKGKWVTIDEDDWMRINEQLSLICRLKPLHKKSKSDSKELITMPQT